MKLFKENHIKLIHKSMINFIVIIMILIVKRSIFLRLSEEGL